jgi:pyridoxine 5'-phosphate synthase PdxJ
MNNHNEKLAQKVVEAFKKNVSVEAREHISERDFHVLALIVQEALSLEMAEAVEMVDELEKRLKKMEGQPELGL